MQSTRQLNYEPIPFLKETVKTHKNSRKILQFTGEFSLAVRAQADHFGNAVYTGFTKLDPECKLGS
jgi:hypothetical protein